MKRNAYESEQCPRGNMEPLKATNSQKKNVTQATMPITHLRDVKPMEEITAVARVREVDVLS